MKVGSLPRHGLVAFVCVCLVPAPANAGGVDVVRDCAEDGMLDGRHSEADKRAALDQIPADLDEYSDCRSVIEGAIGGGGDAKVKAASTGAGSRTVDGGDRSRAARSTARRRARGRAREPIEGELIAQGASGAPATENASAAESRTPTWAWGLLAITGLLALGAARETRTDRPRSRRWT